MLPGCANRGCRRMATTTVEVFVPEFELDGRIHPERIVGQEEFCAYCAEDAEPGPNAPIAAEVRVA